MKIAVCPYCGKRLSYFEAFLNRRKGEYFCNKCGKESNIYFKRSLFVPYLIALLIGVAVTVFYIISKDLAVLFYMFLVLVPFIVFYIICPYFLKLKPMKKYMDSLYNTNYELQLNQKKEEETIFNADIDSNDPIINTDIFDAIKNDRGAVSDSVEQTTRAFSKYEDISSSSQKENDLDKTKRIR